MCTHPDSLSFHTLTHPNHTFTPTTKQNTPRRLLTDEDPALRERLVQVLFQDDKFQWARLTNLIQLAKEGGSSTAAAVAAGTASRSSSNGNAAATAAAAGQLQLQLARNGSSGGGASSSSSSAAGLDLSDTVRDAARLLLIDDKLRRQVIMALTEDNRLHVAEVQQVLALLQADVNPGQLVQQVVRDLPSIGRQAMLSWADKVLV